MGRDRLKRKNRALEAELVTLGSTIEHVQKQNSQTQKDSITLFERIRFLESNTNSNVRTSGSLKNLKGADIENPALMRKYKNLHDQSNDLFDQWKKKERQNRVNQMGLSDKFAFFIQTNILSGSRIVRSIAVGYVFAVHIFIFLLLMKRSTC